MEGAASVLWIDRERDIHEIYEVLLDAYGVRRFAMAEDPVQALAIARSQAFDLIIVDENIGEGDARTFAKTVRANGGPSRAARIAMVTNDDALARAARGGAFDAVLPQPVSARALRDEILSAVRSDP